MSTVGVTAVTARLRLRRLARQLGCLLLLFALNCSAVIADTTSDRRASVGLNLFRALLVADQDIGTDPSDPPMKVHIVYAEDANQAAAYRDQLAQTLTDIRGVPVQVDTLSLSDYLKRKPESGVGAFVSQRLNDQEMQALVAYSTRYQQLLFSPFEGDVERGVLAGLSVQAAVRPYINMATLKQSGIRIKSFYLKVAKTYE